MKSDLTYVVKIDSEAALKALKKAQKAAKNLKKSLSDLEMLNINFNVTEKKQKKWYNIIFKLKK